MRKNRFAELAGVIRAHGRAFWRSRRGNVAMIFALMLVPLTIAAGAGLDFSRAMIVHARLGEALDSAGLAVAAAKGLTQDQIQSLAQSYFDANFKLDHSFGTPDTVTVNETSANDTVVLSTKVNMPTTLMSVAGIKSLPVGFSSTVVWGQTKLWVALVLDNTGSMTETDSTGTSKITALQSASHSLLTMLQNASANAGDVMVSIVPFNRDVNIGSSNYGASWLDWSTWDSSNGSNQYTNCSGGSGGGGGNYYYNRYDGPIIGSGGFYNISYGDGGGYGGGYGGGGYGGGGNRNNCTKTWVPDNHNTWNGCVMDRTQNYDTQNTTPDPTIAATLFPTDQYSSCPLAMMGLSDDWTALGDEIDNMYATGNTNQTIGLAWGWQTMTDGDPMNSGTLPENTQRFIILLSDGLNTQNRWTTSQSSIDAREEKACDNAKAAGITIYTVFVDLNGTSGNSAPLQYCATDSSKYFDLTTSGQIVTAFNTIGEQITNLRVAK